MMDMKNITVSVIVPVYNAEKYLKQCLESLVNQTLKTMEIIIVNDGSTDGSNRIIEYYEKSYKNIIVIEQSNSGIAKARQSGYKYASGDYIGWVDNDDFVELNMYKRLYDQAVEDNADYVYCDYDFYPKKVSKKEKWFKEYKGVIDWNFIERNTHPWNKLVKKELCENISMFELLGEFGDGVYVDLLLRAKKIVCIHDCLYHYRVGHDSVSGSFKGKLDYFLEVAERTRRQKIFLKNTKYEMSLKEYFDYRYIYALLQLCCVSAYNSNKTVYIDALKKLRTLKYKKNRYVSLILQNNYGIFKAKILEYVIPFNYYLALILCKVVFK